MVIKQFDVVDPFEYLTDVLYPQLNNQQKLYKNIAKRFPTSGCLRYLPAFARYFLLPLKTSWAVYTINIQGGPKVGIQLLNCFLCALTLPAVHFMWPKSRHTVNGDNYLEILCEVVVPQLQTKPNFDELFFQQDGTSPHYALRVRDYLNKVFTQRWFGRTGSIEWPPCSPDLTPMDFFFLGCCKEQRVCKEQGEESQNSKWIKRLHLWRIQRNWCKLKFVLHGMSECFEQM